MTVYAIVQKLWNYCNVLRDDLSACGHAQAGAGKQQNIIPKQYNWQSLLEKDGDELFDHYRHLLEELGKKSGLLGLIFGRA